jgi:hypothetical protein
MEMKDLLYIAAFCNLAIGLLLLSKGDMFGIASIFAAIGIVFITKTA